MIQDAAVLEADGAGSESVLQRSAANGSGLARFFSHLNTDEGLGVNCVVLYERFRLRNGFRIGRHYVHLPLLFSYVIEMSVVLAGASLVMHLLASNAGQARLAWYCAVRFTASLFLFMLGMGLFSRRLRDSVRGLALRASICVLAAAMTAGGYSLLFNRPVLPMSLMMAAVCAWSLFLTARLTATRLIRDDAFKRRVLVLGAGRNAAQLQTLRRRVDRRDFTILGHVPLQNELRLVPQDQILEADNRPLTQLAADRRVDEIVFAADDRRLNFPARALLDCRLAGIEVTQMITFLERESGRVYLDLLHPGWLIFGSGFRRDIFRHVSKRTFDLIVSGLLLAVCSPLMLLAALAIKAEEGWSAPVLYRQQRTGFLGKPFDIVKFRSMRVDAEGDGVARWAMARDNRVTRVGAFIRRTRIDELPQLLAIVAGKMSLVGPRPERPDFVRKLSDSVPFYQERHAIKPGLTGWAQLCYPYGASERDSREKQQYDLYYVKHHSIFFDLMILIETMEVVLLGKGAR